MRLRLGAGPKGVRLGCGCSLVFCCSEGPSTFGACSQRVGVVCGGDGAVRLGISGRQLLSDLGCVALPCVVLEVVESPGGVSGEAGSLG